MAVERAVPDRVVAVVGQPQGVVGRHVDAVRTVKYPFAPGAQEVAVVVEDHHRVATAVERVHAVLPVHPDRGHVGVELPPRRQLRPPVVDLVAIGARAQDHRHHAPAGYRVSKIARGLRTSIWSIWSSLIPALRSAGRMSSGMWL